MMRLIEQTRDEKVTMYMKLTKRELIEMLINANAALEQRPLQTEWVEGLFPCTIGPNPWLVTTNV